MKQHLKRKMKNVIANKKQVIVVLITANRAKQKVTNRQQVHKQKSVIILGDSMIKHVSGWKISRKLQGNVKYM